MTLSLPLSAARIHLETSSVLIRQLPIEFVQKPKGWTYAPAELGKPSPPLPPLPLPFIKLVWVKQTITELV